MFVCSNVKDELLVFVKIDVTKVAYFGNIWSKVGGLVCQFFLTRPPAAAGRVL